MRFYIFILLMLFAAPVFAQKEADSFAAGDKSFTAGDFKSMVPTLEDYMAKFPDGEHKDTVRYELAFGHYALAQVALGKAIAAKDATSETVHQQVINAVGEWDTLIADTKDTNTATWARFQAGTWYAQQPGQLDKAVEYLEAVTAYPTFGQFGEASYALMVAYSQQAEAAAIAKDIPAAIERNDKATQAAQDFMDAAPNNYQWMGNALYTQGVLLNKRCDLDPADTGNAERYKKVAENMDKVRSHWDYLWPTDVKYYLGHAHFKWVDTDASLSKTSKTVELNKAIGEMQAFAGDDQGHGARNVLKLDLTKALLENDQPKAAKAVLAQVDADTTATVKVDVPADLRADVAAKTAAEVKP